MALLFHQAPVVGVTLLERLVYAGSYTEQPG